MSQIFDFKIKNEGPAQINLILYGTGVAIKIDPYGTSAPVSSLYLADVSKYVNDFPIKILTQEDPAPQPPKEEPKKESKKKSEPPKVEPPKEEPAPVVEPEKQPEPVVEVKAEEKVETPDEKASEKK